MAFKTMDYLNLMPAIFVGHGSPMYALEENEFVENWQEIGSSIPSPNAILCISAHWETNGTQVTAMEQPPTIHDFGGFPSELFNINYPAPGNPVLAKTITELIQNSSLNYSWGLDHGAWCVLCKMFPNANIPTIQLSIDNSISPKQHYLLAKNLNILRSQGVLIIGSGNLVHNLRMLAWDKKDHLEYGLDWAIQANQILKTLIIENNIDSLLNYKSLPKAVELAIPTPEHFIPLLYILALKNETEKISFFNDKLVMGSIGMTSLIIN